MNFFAYTYMFFILISGMFTATMFYKRRLQFMVGELVSTFLALWIVLAFYDEVALPSEFIVVLLAISYVVYWEGVVNMQIIKALLQHTQGVDLRGTFFVALLSVIPLIYMAVDLIVRYL